MIRPYKIIESQKEEDIILESFPQEFKNKLRKTKLNEKEINYFYDMFSLLSKRMHDLQNKKDEDINIEARAKMMLEIQRREVEEREQQLEGLLRTARDALCDCDIKYNYYSEYCEHHKDGDDNLDVCYLITENTFKQKQSYKICQECVESDFIPPNSEIESITGYEPTCYYLSKHSFVFWTRKKLKPKLDLLLEFKKTEILKELNKQLGKKQGIFYQDVLDLLEKISCLSSIGLDYYSSRSMLRDLVDDQILILKKCRCGSKNLYFRTKEIEITDLIDD